MQESYFVDLHIKSRLKLWKINKIKKIYGVPLTFSPSAADTLIRHFKDTGRTPNDYDLIVSGDLGKVGKSIVVDMLKEAGYDLSKNYNDCGLILFDCEEQDVHSGGSGCACSALTFCGYLYKRLNSKKYNRILFMATGALMSTMSVQQGESIPGIAHAVSICNI